MGFNGFKTVDKRLRHQVGRRSSDHHDFFFCRRTKFIVHVNAQNSGITTNWSYFIIAFP